VGCPAAATGGRRCAPAFGEVRTRSGSRVACGALAGVGEGGGQSCWARNRPEPRLAVAALGEWPAAARLGEGASVCPGEGPAPLLKRPAQHPRG
jgi:hypothetical protein